MNTIKRLVGRSGSLFAALAFTVALVAPAVVSDSVFAAGALSTRKITLSSSAAGGTSTDINGTAVAAGSGGNGAQARHTFNFTIATTGNVGSMAFQYCDSPILSVACNTPTGLVASTVTSIQAQSGFNVAQTFAIDTSTVANTGTYFATVPCSGASPYRQNCILVKRTTAASETAGTTNGSITFGNTGSDWIKNPTGTGTFYVRITTFSDIAYTTVVDQAAVAASIATGIDITAKVQEKLNFSVAAATVAPTTTCAPLTGLGAITLGSGGVLDTSTAYDSHSYFRVSTNSANGTVVSYSGDTLKTAGGTNSISGINSGSPGTADSSRTGVAQFGLALDNSDTQSGNGYSMTNLTTIPAAYASGNGTITNLGTAQFAFNPTSMTSPITLASAPAGTTVSCDTGSIRYVANVSPVTKPGVYQTTINYIATPTY